MARKIIQDVVLTKRKNPGVSVRVPISRKEEVPDEIPAKFNKNEPSSKRKNHLSSGLFNEEKKHSPPFPKLPKRKGERFWEKQPFWWSLGGIIAVGGGIFYLSVFFLRAGVEVTPGKANVPVSLPLIAKKSSSSGVSFEITMTKGTETRQINATGSKNISVKASGRIIVYNNYSSNTQKLIKGTRFVALNGKTYRIQNDIIVPGKLGDTPGQIEVMVYADQAGADYNTGLSDFTIPGFKGDPRYEKFYGRSKTEITGGFSGSAPVASDKDIALAKEAIEKSLKEDLLREASSQVPDGYILYKDAAQISFEVIRDAVSDPKVVTIGENGTLVGFLLKKDSIFGEISKKIKTGEKAPPAFTLDSIDGLTFSFASNTPAIDAKTKEVSFTLSGGADITYIVDTSTLRNDLAGKPKSDFSSILSRYSSIKGARIVSFQPFWARYFPGKAEKISVTIAK
ncbi:MAG: hypothetical protein WC835_01690 [Candidatus Paceibacterota bacterium]|jgi:hypothetical protein